VPPNPTSPFREQFDDELRALAATEKAEKEKEIARCHGLFEQAEKRRGTALWLASGMLLVPFLVLAVLQSHSASSLVFVVFGMAWAAVGWGAVKLERYAQDEVVYRLAELNKARDIKCVAAAELENRAFSKRMSQHEAEWEALKIAHPEKAKAIRDKYLPGMEASLQRLEGLTRKS
jgi:hypothetical protein